MQWVRDLDTEDTICELIESIECVCAKIRKKTVWPKRNIKTSIETILLPKLWSSRTFNVYLKMRWHTGIDLKNIISCKKWESVKNTSRKIVNKPCADINTNVSNANILWKAIKRKQTTRKTVINHRN